MQPALLICPSAFVIHKPDSWLCERFRTNRRSTVVRYLTVQRLRKALSNLLRLNSSAVLGRQNSTETEQCHPRISQTTP
jgi:hypothetical protein